MRKPETSGERIKALRGVETQERFARKLGVTRGAVSAWEKEDKLRRPSAAIYLKLACLANDPEEASWFLEKAQIESDLVFQLAATLGKRRRRGGDTAGVTVYVPPLEGGTALEAEPYPAGRVRHPDSTFFTVLPPGSGSGIFWPEDTVLVDTRYRREGSLLPYWGELVLISFPVRPGEPGRVYELKLEGPQVGWLALDASRHVHDGGVVLEYRAVFEPPVGRSEVVGAWQSPDLGPATSARTGIDYAGLEKSARRDMKLFDGISILGHVVGWLGFGPDDEPWDGPGPRRSREDNYSTSPAPRSARRGKGRRSRQGGKNGRRK